MRLVVGLERGLGEPFVDVKKLDRHKMSVPITLHIGSSHLRITSVSFVLCHLNRSRSSLRLLDKTEANLGQRL